MAPAPASAGASPAETAARATAPAAAERARAQRPRLPRAVPAVARAALALFFLGAVLYKLLHAGEFWVATHKLWPLRLFAPTLRDALTGSVVGLEAAAGVALLVSGWSRHGAALCLALLALFTAVVAPQFDGCACTWQIPPLVPDTTLGLVVRNVVLAGLAAVVLLAPSRTRGAGTRRDAR